MNNGVYKREAGEEKILRPLLFCVYVCFVKN